MLKTNKLRELIDAGKPTVGTRLNTTWPTMVEAAGATGLYDYVEFLAEYSPFSQYDLENIARAAELHDMGTMIKLDKQNRGYVAQRAMASGFQAVFFTDHKNADEVRESLRLIRPDCPSVSDGDMGFAFRRWIGFRPITPQLDFAEMAKKTVAVFMIEKREAMENIEEICAVPGVDMVQFGPYDYGMSCGVNSGDCMERLRTDEKRMIAAALQHGVRPRCELNSVDEAKYYIDLGVRDFKLGLEILVMQTFWTKEGRVLSDMLFV